MAERGRRPSAEVAVVAAAGQLELVGGEGALLESEVLALWLMALTSCLLDVAGLLLLLLPALLVGCCDSMVRGSFSGCCCCLRSC